MESLGFTFGIMGVSMGSIGFTFGLIAMSKVDKLEKKLEQQERIPQS